MNNLEVKSKYKEMFKECIILSEKYELSTDTIKKYIDEINDFKVTTPVIGGFSTGKSSMINAILEDNILSTQITPETSIPTEVCYGNNKVFLFKNGSVEEISIENFKEEELNANTTELVKLEYNNNFLSQISDVKIVDMPGFDSGIELHNKAIDKYLPNSLAYIITFSADEPIIKQSIANFLGELKLHDIPVYIVITKCDKVTPEDLEKCKDFMRANIPKYLEVKDIRIACVKSKRDRDVSEVKKFLVEIQHKSNEIFEKSFSMKLKNVVSLMEKYFVSILNNKELSITELEEKEKELENNKEEIIKKLEKEKNAFDNQLRKCIDSIKVKISNDLIDSSSTLENMLLNERNIKEKINIIIRGAVIAGIKNEFEPKLQKYLKNVAELVDINVMLDTEINLNEFKVVADNMVKEVITKSIPVILTAIGGALGGPIIAIIGGAIAILIENLFKAKHDKERRELARQKIQGEIIPLVVEESGKSVETEIFAYIEEINKEIYQGMEKQQEIIQKSLQAIRLQKKEEEEWQKNRIKELTSDLDKVRYMVNGI